MDQDSTDEPTSADERLHRLTPGTTVRVSDLSDAFGGYSATVTEHTDRLIWTDIPIRRDGMLTLGVGQLVSIRFDRPGDAVYLFDTVLAEQRDDDSSPYGFARPVVVDRRPHRTDVRLALVLDARYRGADQADDELRPAKVVDLSAGGIGLITDGDHSVDDELRVAVDLTGPDETLQFSSSVVIRSRSLYGRTPGGATLQLYGLQFTEIDDRIRERLLASVIWNLTQNPAVL